ncbi:tetratricopeptide repeat protein [Elstera cyanobacteriorum]|uniref:tetratricopeptide repeat protein n=1 Tax=Elstera cyanobacteriorum TaxID=2022747 RepID=UPI002357152B|nr:tetratricopeptide repeat protein [Elstera cyanobacteriorum]MCK6442766.1 tetratricopeptide repeat protein [Elstera cyanobacteriorum]
MIQLNLADAFAAWERGDAATARQIVRTLLRKQPKLAGAHYLTGLLCLGDGEAGKAVQALRLALTHGPDSPALRLALGRAYAMGGAQAQAEENFRTALTLVPGLPAALWSLSDLYFRSGRGADALPLLRDLTAARPEDALAWERIGILHRQHGNLTAALDSFDTVLKLEADQPRGIANRAAVLLDLGRTEAALTELTEALSRHPEDAGLARTLALAHIRAGRAAAALPLYEALLADAADPTLSRDYAEALIKAGRTADAVPLLRAVTEALPDDAAAWFLLGEAARAVGESEAAQAAYRQALTLDPADRLGAGPALALLGGGAGPEALPAPYVTALFNDYATRFDTELTETLNYRGPDVLRALLDQHAPRPGLRILDVGCGTGLSAVPFANIASEIIGIDLSPAMLAQAAARGLYREVIEGEAVATLAARPPASADLILAADVLVYLGDLAPFHAAAARVLGPGGRILASVEAHPDSDANFSLHDGFRYRHGADALKRLLHAHSYRILALTPVTTRLNKGEPVPGLAYLAEVAPEKPL